MAVTHAREVANDDEDCAIRQRTKSQGIPFTDPLEQIYDQAIARRCRTWRRSIIAEHYYDPCKDEQLPLEDISRLTDDLSNTKPPSSKEINDDAAPSK